MVSIKNPRIVLLLLTLAYMLSFMDRYVMNLLLNDVKADFELTETQAGLLAGAGFAVLYALMTLPMGILADRTNRAKLAAWGVVIWSTMTMVCGVGRNFIQLAAGRVGVGIGEAALTPAAYPLIKSLFSKERLTTALGVYSSGIYIGSGLAYLLGGHLLQWVRANQVHQYFSFVPYDWQIVFLLFGLPGLLVGALLYMVSVNNESTNTLKQQNVSQLFDFIKANHCFFAWFAAGSALFNVAVYAAGVWLPAYLQRVHGMTVIESGEILGTTMLFIAPVGAIAGGIVADKLASKYGLVGRIKAIFVLVCLIAGCFCILALPLEGVFKYVPMLVLSLLMGAPVAITAAIVQDIAPAHLRSTAPAFLLMLQNLLGMSLGPLLVALLTQYVFANEVAVGKSIAITGSVFCMLSAILFAKAQNLKYE